MRSCDREVLGHSPHLKELGRRESAIGVNYERRSNWGPAEEHDWERMGLFGESCVHEGASEIWNTRNTGNLFVDKQLFRLLGVPLEHEHNLASLESRHWKNVLRSRDVEEGRREQSRPLRFFGVRSREGFATTKE